MGKITGEGGPEIEQGTPVQEVLSLLLPSQKDVGSSWLIDSKAR